MKKRIVLLTLLAILLSSCGVNFKSASEEVLYPMAPMAQGMSDSYYTEASQDGSSEAYSGGELRTQETQPRLVIKTASLSIVVEDPAASLDAISNLATDTGGFVVSSNLYRVTLDGGLEVPQANITIRVPSEKLDQALAEIKSGAGQILNENISGQDVTQEYTDLGSRLKNLERAEEQLTAIMEQAWETEDVLSVYNRLVEVQEQIELIKGQMQYYQQSSALSAISVDIRANEAVQPLKIGNWQPVGVAKRALQALIDTLKFFGNVIIWLGLYILPVVVILYFPARWVWKGVKKLNSRRKEKREQRKAQREKTQSEKA
jgi:hypothetical protein